MMKKLFVVMLVTAVIVAAGTAEAKKKQVIRVQGGTNIGGVGLVIDASYDPRLDALVPGYKVINVALINQSFNMIPLDPEKDEWSIKIGDSSKAFKVLHNLRSQDSKAWAQLPERVRGIVSYPLVLPIGAREVVDLFAPAELELERFTELDVVFRSLGGKIEVLVRQ